MVTASSSVAGRSIAAGTATSISDHLFKTSLKSSADESSRMTVFDESFCFNDERKVENTMMRQWKVSSYVES